MFSLILKVFIFFLFIKFLFIKIDLAKSVHICKYSLNAERSNTGSGKYGRQKPSKVPFLNETGKVEMN